MFDAVKSDAQRDASQWASKYSERVIRDMTDAQLIDATICAAKAAEVAEAFNLEAERRSLGKPEVERWKAAWRDCALGEFSQQIKRASNTSRGLFR